MKTIRVRNSDGVDEMDYFLLDEVDMDHERTIKELKNGLETNGENIYLLQTWDYDKETKKVGDLLAFILAVNYPEKSQVLIYQVWRNTEKTNIDLIDSLMHRVILWTENFGKNKLRIESYRDPMGVSKLWKFKNMSTTMEFVIPDDFEFPLHKNEILDPVVKEK